MKLPMIFLSTLLAITNQKFHHPMGLNWFPAQQIAKYYQPYNNDHQYGIPFLNQFRPSRLSAYYQDDELLNQGLNAFSNTANDKNYNKNDVLSETNGYINPALHDKYNPRFFYFGSASPYHNPIFKTATFTITSYINVTRIQICVPSTAFATGATTCRRKRSDIDFPWMNEPARYEQFYIAPTEVHKVEPTLLQEDIVQEKIRHIYNTHLGLASSKQQETNDDELESQNGHHKKKRFVFKQYVASSTITSYTFLTTIVTKTVNLAAKNGALCRPEGYVNCDQLILAEVPIG